MAEPRVSVGPINKGMLHPKTVTPPAPAPKKPVPSPHAAAIAAVAGANAPKGLT